MRRFRVSPAMAVAVVAVVLSVTGSAVAAKLITGKQIKDGSISAKDLSKAVRLQLAKPGGAGAKGDSGAAGPQGVPGPKGDAGAAGPGARSFDGQFAADNQNRLVTTIDGMDLNVNCQVGGSAAIQISRASADLTLVGWGTTADGATSKLAIPVSGDMYVTAAGGTVTMDVTVAATAPAASVRYAHFDVRVVNAATCTYHAMVTPSTP